MDKAAKIFGSANITVMIQSVKIDQKYFISSSNGRDLENINPTVWAKRVENYGAGEIILTSVNNEGLKNGFQKIERLQIFYIILKYLIINVLRRKN